MQSEDYLKQQTIQPRVHQLNCQQNHTVTFLCASPSCPNNPFVCSQQSCKCKSLHESCLLVEPQRLTKIIQKKLIDSEGIIKEVDKIAEQCIDWVSDWRDQMYQQLKFYGLTQIEKKYILAVRSNSSQNLNGKLLFDVVQTANLQNNVAKVQKAIQQINQYWKKEIKKFHSIFNEIQSMICNSQTCILTVQSLSSKIVNQKEELKTLRSFFNKKIRGFKLLYRASENAFSVTSFYNKCSNIPNTLVLIRTQFNKIIGGFTPICWKIGAKEETFADPLKQSFIFSLTNGDKFKLIDQTKATQYYGDSCGPRFGGLSGASDLTIKDKANDNNESYSLYNNCYFNDNYKKSDSSSYRRFNGGESNFFKIKQWEVYEVQFQ